MGRMFVICWHILWENLRGADDEIDSEYAAASGYHRAIPLVVVDCDNNGVVSHGNAPLRSLPTNQTQADVLCTFKQLVSAQPFCIIDLAL
jgi:hypothetical protein